MYRSTAIFIKILQRRSQFRRVNIFRCYTFINSVWAVHARHEEQQQRTQSLTPTAAVKCEMRDRDDQSQ